MDRGTDRAAPAGQPAGRTEGADGPATGRFPLAVVVVDRDGLVSHWSGGARRLFGTAADAAIGRPATDLLPVTGALVDDDERYGPYARYDIPGPRKETSLDPLDGGSSHPAAGRARLTVPAGDRVDVLWWAYPLLGPGPGRLLVLAADAARLRPRGTEEGEGAAAVARIVPGFAPHTDIPGAAEPAGRLPEVLPGMSAADRARLVSRVLELGWPVLEFSRPGCGPALVAATGRR